MLPVCRTPSSQSGPGCLLGEFAYPLCLGYCLLQVDPRYMPACKIPKMCRAEHCALQLDPHTCIILFYFILSLVSSPDPIRCVYGSGLSRRLYTAECKQTILSRPPLDHIRRLSNLLELWRQCSLGPFLIVLRRRFVDQSYLHGSCDSCEERVGKNL